MNCKQGLTHNEYEGELYSHAYRNSEKTRYTPMKLQLL